MFYDLMNNYVLDDVAQIISPLIMQKKIQSYFTEEIG